MSNLIGRGADQVPVNGMLGKMAFVDSAGDIVHLSTISASASATIDIETTFDANFDEYLIIASGVVLATDNDALNLLMKIGGTYLTTTTYAYHRVDTSSAASTYSGVGSEAQSNIVLCVQNSNVASEPINLRIWVHKPSSTVVQKTIEWAGSSLHSTTPSIKTVSGVGVNSGTAALTGIRFSGATTITSGIFKLYGIKPRA